MLGGIKKNKKGKIVGARAFQLELLIDQTLEDFEIRAVEAAIEGDMLSEEQLDALVCGILYFFLVQDLSYSESSWCNTMRLMLLCRFNVDCLVSVR